MNCCDRKNADHGPNPYVVNVKQAAVNNQNYREAIWTGTYFQMTLMSIPACGEIGEAVFVPAGTWHNVINSGRNSLKVSSVYAPPHHLRGTVQQNG